MNRIVLCLVFLLPTLAKAQNIGFQVSIQQLNFDYTKEKVVSDLDTSALFYPEYQRGNQDLGLSIGVTYRTAKYILSAKTGYYQDYFTNKETEAGIAYHSFTKVKNNNYGLYWELGISKIFFQSKRVFMNYGLNTGGTLDLKNYVSINTDYFDQADNFLAKVNSDYQYPGTTTFFINPSWSFNYVVYRDISLGISFDYGLQYTRIHGDFMFTKSTTDTNGGVLLNDQRTVEYTYNKLALNQGLSININYNLNPTK